MEDLFMNKQNGKTLHERKMADFFINKNKLSQKMAVFYNGLHCTWTRDWAVDSAVQSPVSNVLKNSIVIYEIAP